jgi:hypothetical protein
MCGTIVFSQDDPPADQQVIFLGIFNLGQNDTRNFTTTAQGTVWGIYPSDPFSISENEDAYQSTYSQTGNSGTEPTNWGGWDIVTHSTIPEVIGFGLYKMTTDDYPNVYFYFNNRDCHYSFACGGPPPNYNPDAFFKYLADYNIFQYRIRGQSEFVDINNGQLINSWDMLNYGTLPSSYGFEDFWENVLAMTNNGSDNPRIVWGRHPSDGVNFVVEEYKIYRAMTYYEEDEIVFYHIESVDGSELDYVDYDVEINQSSVLKVYYKVTATYNDNQDVLHETSPTNTVWIRGYLGKRSASYSLPLSNSIFQNYPNPFNPVTSINYSIESAGLITLKVYNILGTEVASLVDEVKQAGRYTVLFDASELPSGVYFYTLSAGNFTFTKKLILLK